MKLQWIVGGAIALSVVSCGGDNAKKEAGHTDNAEHNEVSNTASSLSSDLDSLSYALGVNISDAFSKQKIDGIKTEKMSKGFSDYLSGNLEISAPESATMIYKFMNEPRTKDSLGHVHFSDSYLDSLSYVMGVNISESFKKQGVEGLKGEFLAQGFSDFAKDKSLLNPAEALNFLQVFQMKQQQKTAQKTAGPAIEEGKKFLAENGKRPEVTTLPSGLQYEIIKEGTGEKPTIENTVSTHYHGTLLDGTVFDSSVERGKPSQFGVGQVIAGWTEALQLMPVGSKWKLYLPYNLAYGERGAGGKIKPYATLIFDIELLEIVK